MNDVQDDIKQSYEEMLSLDKKSADISRIIISDKMTKEDWATDLSPKQALCLTVLEAIQLHLKSPVLNVFIEKYKIGRKSVGRKSRKEMVEMFKSLQEQEKQQFERFRDLMGVS